MSTSTAVFCTEHLLPLLLVPMSASAQCRYQRRNHAHVFQKQRILTTTLDPFGQNPSPALKNLDVVESAELAVEPDWDAGVIAARSHCCRVAASEATALVFAPQRSKTLSGEKETVA